MNRIQTRPPGTQATRTRAAATPSTAVTRARLRAAVLALAAATVAAVAAGCTASAPSAPVPGGTAAPAPAAPGGRAGTSLAVAAASASAAASGANCDVYASSRAPLPGPPQVTSGSFMATIKQRGYLVAGVDANTYHFEYRNPRNGSFEGFDIDRIRAVAQAIFGDPNKVQYKALTNDERKPDLINSTVDIVAHTYTITCDRLKDVAFSTVYFDAHRRLLVLDSSHATSLNDLGGQPVCATTSSDAIASIKSSPSHPKVVTAPYITDCLVMLQQGQAAAIISDDTILESLAAQDPYTKIVGPALTDEPYGLAISKAHPDFVQFVNAVLASERTSGAWKASYVKWVGGTVPPLPRVGYAS